MSLTARQRAMTIREFHDNVTLLGLTAAQIGADFNVPGTTIDRIINLRSGVLEHPWIIRNYLLEKAAVANVTPIPFSALHGDPHDYWFLDGRIIDDNRID